MPSVKPKLNRYIRKYQSLLRLNDWTIRSHTYTTANSDEGGRLQAAYVTWCNEERTADLHVLSPSAPEAQLIDYDMEELVVHEMLHLLVAGHRECEANVHDERIVRVLTPLVLKAGRMRK